VNLDFTEEQQALRDFFDKESPPSAVRAAEPAGWNSPSHPDSMGKASVRNSGPSTTTGPLGFWPALAPRLALGFRICVIGLLAQTAQQPLL